MDVVIAYYIALLSTFALIVMWFVNSYKVLYQKRDAVYKAREELHLHQNGYRKKLGSLDEPTAKHILNTSIQIYEKIRAEYNKTIKKPIYRIPRLLMGFKSIVE